MPQQEERIIEGPLSPDYVVEKSRRILNLSDMVYSTMQMKFLDIYLSRIDPRDENSRTVRFTLDELADLFGVERIRYERIGTLLGESQDLKETHKDLPLDQLENIKFTYEIDDEEKRGFVKGVSLRDFIPWKNIGIVWRNPAMPIFSVPGAVRLLQ